MRDGETEVRRTQIEGAYNKMSELEKGTSTILNGCIMLSWSLLTVESLLSHSLLI